MNQITLAIIGRLGILPLLFCFSCCVYAPQKRDSLETSYKNIVEAEDQSFRSLRVPKNIPDRYFAAVYEGRFYDFSSYGSKGTAFLYSLNNRLGDNRTSMLAELERLCSDYGYTYAVYNMRNTHSIVVEPGPYRVTPFCAWKLRNWNLVSGGASKFEF